MPYIKLQKMDKTTENKHGKITTVLTLFLLLAYIIANMFSYESRIADLKANRDKLIDIININTQTIVLYDSLTNSLVCEKCEKPNYIIKEINTKRAQIIHQFDIYKKMP